MQIQFFKLWWYTSSINIEELQSWSPPKETFPTHIEVASVKWCIAMYHKLHRSTGFNIGDKPVTMLHIAILSKTLDVWLSSIKASRVIIIIIIIFMIGGCMIAMRYVCHILSLWTSYGWILLHKSHITLLWIWIMWCNMLMQLKFIYFC